MVDHDPKLSRELRRLPAPRAGEGFTRAVMARLDTEPPAVPWLTLPRLAMVATAVVAVAVALSPTFREPFPGGGGAVPPTVAGDAAGPAGLEGSAAAAEPESTPPGRSALDEASVEPGARRGAPPTGTGSAAGEHGDEGRSGAAASPTYRPDRRVVRVTERPGGETAATEAPAAAQAAAGDSRPGTARPAAFELADFDPAAFDPGALDDGEREQALRRLAELRREQRQLDRRLTALAALVAPESVPALLLGGDESVELVLDLTAAAPTAGDMRPASYRPGGPPGRL
jgi:hypothetical protein